MMIKDVTRDDFEYWLFDMDQELEALFRSVPDDLRKKLDYSLESLIDLEGYLLEKYSEIKEIRVESEKKNLSRFSRYVGETIRKVVGGKWDIELDDPDNAFYRIPTLQSEKHGGCCPLTLVTASLDRRSGDYIFSVAKVHKERAESRE